MADLLQIRSYFVGVIARVRGEVWKHVTNTGRNSNTFFYMGFQVMLVWRGRFNLDYDHVLLVSWQIL